MPSDFAHGAFLDAEVEVYGLSRAPGESDAQLRDRLQATLDADLLREHIAKASGIPSVYVAEPTPLATLAQFEAEYGPRRGYTLSEWSRAYERATLARVEEKQGFWAEALAELEGIALHLIGEGLEGAMARYREHVRWETGRSSPGGAGR